MLALAGIHNAGYLILPIGTVLFPGQFDKFALYCFLHILGMTPLLWSLGKYLVSSADDEKISWSGITTPPFIASITAIGLVFVKAGDYIPAVAVESVDLLGSATVPLATFILGAVLGSIHLNIRPHLADGVRALGIKLLLIPLLTVIILRVTGVFADDGLMARFLVLQAAAAPATGLILQVRNYGGDEQKISSLMLLSYIACVFTMPLWMAVWEIVQ